MSQTTSRQNPDDIDLGALWRAVADRGRLLLGLVVGSALVTLIALQFVTPLYTSQARILIEHDDGSFLRPRNAQGDNDARTQLDPEAIASQVQVLLSRDLAYQVVKKLKLDENPEFNSSAGFGHAIKQVLISIGLVRAPTVSAREDLALDNFSDRLSVYQVEKSRVIAINFSSRNPQTAAEVANALSEAYLAWAQKTKLAQTKGASNWLREQIDTLRTRVNESEEAVENFRSSSGLIEGANNVTLQTQQLSELNSQLIMARAQRSEAEARANLIRRMLKEKGDVAAAPDVLKSALIQRLLEQRVQVQRQLAELSATLLPSHPRIRELNSELGDLQGQIRGEAQKVVSSLENEAQIAGAREASLDKSLNDLKKTSSGSREKEIKLRSLEREAKANRDLLESYLARYSEASARDEMSVPAHATIISRAHVENEPSFPQVIPITLLVAFAVGLLSVALLIARELMTGANTAYKSSTQPASRPQVVRETYAAQETPEPHEAPEEPAEPEYPPATPAPSAKKPIAGLRRRTVSARSIKEAARLTAKHAGSDYAQLAIVTASTHQANTAQDTLDLARAVAGSKLRAVIVDFSTSGQNIASLANLANAPGLAELLAGSAGFEDVISADPESSVQIIPPGALHRDAFTDGLDANWSRIQSALRQTYDCVIVHASLSGARRLVAGLGQDELVSVVLVVEGREDALLIDQIAEHLVTDDSAAVELITCKGSKPATPATAAKSRVAAFGQRTAATI